MAAGKKAYSKQSVKKTGRERKEKLVAELTEKIDSANGLVFADYKGISHQQLETLRRELKAADSSLLIAKNSLMKISLGKSKNFADYKDNESLEGPIATLFTGKDSIEPLKKLQKSIKDTGLPKVKFGILEGQLLDEAGVIKLASLPSREVLLAQFVGMLNAPIQGFVSGLNAIPQKFVMTLDAIAKNKPAKAAEPTPASTNNTAETPSADAPAATEQTSNPEEPKEEVANEKDKPTDETSDAKAGVNETNDESAEQTKDETETTDEKGGEDK